jgi:hypothetical protein
LIQSNQRKDTKAIVQQEVAAKNSSTLPPQNLIADAEAKILFDDTLTTGL